MVDVRGARARRLLVHGKSGPLGFPGVLSRYLLCESQFILLELVEASFIDETNFLFAAILSNLLVEISEPEHDT